MFCKQCGTANSDTAKFCKSCGTPLIQAEEKPTAIVEAEEEQTVPAVEAEAPVATTTSAPPALEPAEASSTVPPPAPAAPASPAPAETPAAPAAPTSTPELAPVQAEDDLSEEEETIPWFQKLLSVFKREKKEKAPKEKSEKKAKAEKAPKEKKVKAPQKPKAPKEKAAPKPKVKKEKLPKGAKAPKEKKAKAPKAKKEKAPKKPAAPKKQKVAKPKKEGKKKLPFLGLSKKKILIFIIILLVLAGLGFAALVFFTGGVEPALEKAQGTLEEAKGTVEEAKGTVETVKNVVVKQVVLENATLALEIDPKTAEPITPATSYLAGTRDLYASVFVKNIKGETKVSSVWTYISTNMVFSETEVLIEKDEQVSFKVKVPGGVPRGEYKVDILVEDEIRETLNFTVT